MTPRLALCASTALVLAACSNLPMGTMPPQAMTPFSQDSLPETVKVPAGHRVAMETVGVGEITYECRVKAGMGDSFEWVFVGPEAALKERSGRTVGRYFGPPATWQSMDGSKVTATQLAVAPAGSGNIPLQLVKANPATGSGAMTGVSHIQRVATRGGVAPAAPCTSSSLGQKQVVSYQADYIFWKPAA
ncbi:uncharacterized protein DUF3455 [Sphaerotilus hippei]|uniref:Uncharacterized protein DUF3455 n=1 Tax=Sphaerotilus hippei TaxID=744406 RepID=A0A318H734_9BURK|nr:DUF3455 domain-containing protein [Sphaerotilus hippei]PXW99571.1 uncharacterized protein DUF3455 [Sphaerotilus hippei]